MYSMREKLIDTEPIQVVANRQKGMLIPHAGNLLTIGADALYSFLVTQKRNDPSQSNTALNYDCMPAHTAWWPA